jgi:hypothetical protein
MKSRILRGLTMLALSAVLVAVALATANAAPLHRLASNFQNNTTVGGSGEISTTLAPPGLLVYSKTLSIPFEVVYITFSAQGDAHNGSALLMKASVADASGAETACEPLAGQSGTGGGGPSLFPHWYTLLKLPITEVAPLNCNDGGGGTADCHDNTIMFSCCALIRPDTASPPTTHTVNIRLADLPGGDSNFAFYERSTIYVDAGPNPGGDLCSGVGLPAGPPS